MLDDLGLTSALAALASDFDAHGTARVRRSVGPGLPPLGADVELVLYRVAQEALTNVARHADAQEVHRVADPPAATRSCWGSCDDGRDGLGVDRPRAPGCSGMQERALMVGGTLQRRRAAPGPGPGCGSSCRWSPRCGVTRILLADDHALVRRGVRLILDAGARPHGRGRGRRRRRGGRLLRETPVDLVVLDIAMPRTTGLQAAREIARRRDPPRMLMLSMHDNEQYFFEALKAWRQRLRAQVGRRRGPGRRRAARRCAARRSSTPARWARWCATTSPRLRRGERVPDTVLTEREDEVLKLIAEGSLDPEIAATLVISPKTVERHRANILAKLGMRDRTQLTRYAIRAGLIEP